jgi:peptidoglycan/LPS O-acetylase OafA/YrhL
MSTAQKKNGWTGVMRWMARILALLVIGLFVLFLAESGTAIISQLSFGDPQGHPVLIALVVALAGVTVAWRWELVGGIMSIAGSLAIIGLVCIGSGTGMFLCSLFFTAPLLLAGSLYLTCCYGTRAHTTAQRARKPAKLPTPCNQTAQEAAGLLL